MNTRWPVAAGWGVALAWLLGTAMPAQGPASGATAARALAAYERGEFAAARALYGEALAAPGADLGALLFGLGNCAYREGHFAEALVAYRRALLRRPRDEQLRFNAAWTADRLGGERSPPSLIATLLSPLQRFTLRELLLAAGLLQAGGLLGAFLARRSGARAAAVATAGTGVLVGVHVVFVAWFAAPEAIVLESRTPVRGAPAPTAAAIHQLRAGDTVVVLDRTSTWLQVTHPSGSGWVPESTVTVVK